jgi:hypothetical protein
MLYPDGDVPKLEGFRSMERRLAEESELEYAY